MDATARQRFSGGVLGRTFPEEVLSRALYATQFTRQIDRHGFVKFKHWRFYGERGLDGEDVSVWVYEGNADRSSIRPLRSPCTSFPSKKALGRSPR
jgi:hypothetical protein